MNALRTISGWLGLWAFAVTLSAAEEAWTLPRAVEYALMNSPDARIAEKRILAARAGLDQATAGVWPQLRLGSSYIYTDNPLMVFGSILNQQAFDSSIDFNNVPDTDNLNVRGVLTMPVYAGGETRARRQSARAAARAAGKDAEAVRNFLGFEVARAFHTLLKTREFLLAARTAVQAFEQNVAIARKRYNAGTLLKTEVLDVEVRLAGAREDLIRAKNSNALAQRALRNLLGLEGEGIEVAGTSPDVECPEQDDYSRRPELDAFQERETAARSAVQGAKSGYKPKVHAFGRLDYDHGWRTDGGGGYWTAGALLDWNLWDGRLTRAKVSEARAHLDTVAEQQRKVRLAIELEVQQARLRLEEASERLQVTATVVAQARESAELTRARFEQGLAISTQLIDAETALTAARVRRAEAEADRKIAIAALRKALGMPQTD